MPAAPDPTTYGVHLTRTDENAAEIDELADLVGGRVGLSGVLSDLDQRARRSLAPGLLARQALTWEREDRRTTTWWPQGISTSADATPDEAVEGRRLLMVSWYAKSVGGRPNQGSRITVVDLESRRYRHVLLVEPVRAADGSVSFEPLRVHAGGIVWCGPYLHVAATARGFVTCRLDDILDTGGRADPGTFGYRHVLPVRFTYRAGADEGHERLRYSCLSLDRAATPPELVVGEYGRGGQTRRLARFALDPESLLLVDDQDAVSRPLALDDRGVGGTQGATVARGDFFLTVSHGPWKPGSVYVGSPGAFRRRRFVTPMGPEDIAYWPSTDTLWSVSEHPRRRWVFAMRRSRLA